MPGHIRAKARLKKKFKMQKVGMLLAYQKYFFLKWANMSTYLKNLKKTNQKIPCNCYNLKTVHLMKISVKNY